MVLSDTDLLAVIIALVAMNTVLILAFRRVYVLEMQVTKLRHTLSSAKSIKW